MQYVLALILQKAQGVKEQEEVLLQMMGIYSINLKQYALIKQNTT